MIKFFRRIRQNILSQNKISKYLLYAIGEIILVVIGILIALSINNWNEDRKKNSEETTLLKALNIEFKTNLFTLDSIFSIHKGNENATQLLMNASGKSYSIEKLDSLYLKAVYNYNFDPSRGIYNSLINSGKIELLKNKTLKYKIAQIQDIVTDYIEDENILRGYIRADMSPYIINHMPYNPLRQYKNSTQEERSKHKQLFYQMIEDRIFKEHLSMLSLYRISIFNEGKKVKKEYTEIIRLIDKQLNHNKVLKN